METLIKKRKKRDGVFKQGKVWYIDYYFGSRRIRKAIGPSKRTATNALRKIKVEIAEGKYLDKQAIEKIKFSDFAEQYLGLYCKHNHKPGSFKKDINAANILKRYFGDKYIDEISTFQIERFKAEFIKTVKPATVNRRIAFLKAMLNRAIEWEKLKENPARKVKLFRENNKRTRFLEREEIKKLIDNADGYIKNILIIAINTGMRRGEILKLKWRDIDFKNSLIYLNDTKNSESRQVPINDAVKSALISTEKNTESPYIFCKPNGQPRFDIRKSFLQAQKKSGILNFRFHDLRHTFASQLVMAGIDLNTVRELLGHKSIQMTQRYSHLSPLHKQRAVSILDSRLDIIQTYDKKDTIFENLDFEHNSLKNQELVNTRGHSSIG
ncbi:MAG: site-specific integrase [Candidatus Omnitrophica bacterium]|nr:site-specific integrase [Candidatus Omnitrophota bacterium]